MDIKDYHAHPALGSSTIREILKSSAHYAYKLTHKVKKTDSMILGDAIHAFILEPNRFADMYELFEDVYMRAVGGHNVGDPKLDENGEPIVYLKDRNGEGLDIKGEQYKKFVAMTEAIRKSQLVKDIMTQSTHIEYSIFSKIMGFDVKCRPDTMNVDAGIIWDVKTVSNKSDSGKPADNFIREFISMGYDVQAALYKRLCEEKFLKEFEFRFLCVDVSKDVVGIKEYKVSDELIELGERRLKWCLEQIKQYNETKSAKVYDCESEELKADYRALEMLEKFRGEE